MLPPLSAGLELDWPSSYRQRAAFLGARFCCSSALHSIYLEPPRCGAGLAPTALGTGKTPHTQKNTSKQKHEAKRILTFLHMAEVPCKSEIPKPSLQKRKTNQSKPPSLVIPEEK